MGSILLVLLIITVIVVGILMYRYVKTKDTRTLLSIVPIFAVVYGSIKHLTERYENFN